MELNELKPYLDAIEDYQLSSLYGGTLPRHWRVELRTATHGRGLFACERIPAGVAITLYPAHAVGRPTGSGTYTMNVPQDLPYRPRSEYNLCSPSGEVYSGFPEITTNDWLIGHIANDVADTACFRRGREYDSAVLYSIMAQGANMRVEWYKNIPIMMTTREVEANEELVWSYGVQYWFTHCDIPNANQRITAYLLRQPRRQREQMMMLLTQMGDIFQASALKDTTTSSGS